MTTTPRRRVLMTADAVGGVWTYALDLAGGLAARGADCVIALLGPEPDADQMAQAGRVPGLELHRTGLPLDWLARNPGEVLAAGREVAALAERTGAGLVQLNAPALAAGGAFAVPVVAVCHSCVRTWWDSVRGGALPDDFAWRAELVARGYATARAVVAPTRAFAALTRVAYGLRQAPAVVHNGRQPRALPAPDAPAAFFFTAGRLWDEGKNLAALDRVAARLPWEVIAAGPTEGPNGARVALRHVRPLGRLDQAGVARLLAARPVFVSLARYEPFGLAVLEAAQAGCALALADRPGFRELWEGAALFLPDAEDAAVAALARLAADPAERDRLAQRAAERAARYTVAAMAAAMDRIHRGIHCGLGAVEAAA